MEPQQANEVDQDDSHDDAYEEPEGLSCEHAPKKVRLVPRIVNIFTLEQKNEAYEAAHVLVGDRQDNHENLHAAHITTQAYLSPLEVDLAVLHLLIAWATCRTGEQMVVARR